MEQLPTNAEGTEGGILDERRQNNLPKIIPVHLGGSDGQTWRREDMYGDDGR
jgi:hypothetical protein